MVAALRIDTPTENTPTMEVNHMATKDGLQLVQMSPNRAAVEAFTQFAPAIDSILVEQGYSIVDAQVKSFRGQLTFTHENMWADSKSTNLSNLIEVPIGEYENPELANYVRENPSAKTALEFYYSSSLVSSQVIRLNPIISES